MNKIKNEKIPNGSRMVSFEVKPLFTNVPSDQTIQINSKEFMKNIRFQQILPNRR